MDINLGVLLIQIVNLAVVIFLLRKFLFQPYLAYMVKQEEKQVAIDEAAETISRITSEAEEEANAILADAHKKASVLREKAEDIAQAQADEVIDEANENAARIQKKAAADIDLVEKKLKERYTEDVLEAALLMNKKLFKNEATANEAFFKQNS